MILRLRLLFLFSFLSLLTGCGNLLYLSHLGWHQSFVTFRSVPVEEVLLEEVLGEEAAKKIRLILEVKDYGEKRLGLKETKNYTKFFEAKGLTLYLLTASEKDRLQPYSWKFPVIGRVTYKSIFTLKAALKEKRKMERQGFDTYLQMAAAYSTLGWLTDPIFSTMLLWEEPALVNIILHEMVHATIHFKGETELNEQLATFIGNKGAIEFLREKYGPNSKEVSLAIHLQEDDLRFANWIEGAYQQLSEFYAQPLSREEKLKGREKLFESLREEFLKMQGEFRTECYKGFEKKVLNNAVILAHRRYLGHLHRFEELYERLGKDLRKFVEHFKKIKGLPLPLASNELLDHDLGLMVGKLEGRVFHRIGRDGDQRAADPSVACDLAAPDGVDGDPPAVRGVFDREPQFEIQGNLSEPSSFHPEKADLVVVLPGDVVRRADVDVLRFERISELGLDGFGFRNPLVLQPAPVEHVEKIGISTGIDLVGPVEFHPPVFEEFGQGPMDDGRPHLGFHIVTHGRDPLLLEPFRPIGIRDDETGHAVDETHPCIETGLRIELSSLIRTDRKVIEEDLHP